MNIYINGMELPKDGYKTVYIHSNGYVYEPTSDNLLWNTIGKAIELPEHGGLIDVETLGEALWAQRMQYQMLDDTHTADKIMHGIYRAEQIIKKIKPVVPAGE